MTVVKACTFVEKINGSWFVSAVLPFLSQSDPWPHLILRWTTRVQIFSSLIRLINCVIHFLILNHAKILGNVILDRKFLVITAVVLIAVRFIRLVGKVRGCVPCCWDCLLTRLCKMIAYEEFSPWCCESYETLLVHGEEFWLLVGWVL
jgi:hypothetical protein